jgi:hypothetical protein
MEMAGEIAGWVAASIGAVAGATAVVGVFGNGPLTIGAGMPSSKSAEENFGNLVFMQTSKGHLFRDRREPTRERVNGAEVKGYSEFCVMG